VITPSGEYTGATSVCAYTENCTATKQENNITVKTCFILLSLGNKKYFYTTHFDNDFQPLTDSIIHFFSTTPDRCYSAVTSKFSGAADALSIAENNSPLSATYSIAA